MQAHNFKIAELNVRIVFAGSEKNSIKLLPSFAPFSTEAFKEDLFFQLTVDDQLRPVPKEERKHIRNFDTGNGDTIVDKLEDGGYQYIIKDIKGADCCLLITNKDFSNCRCALNGNYPYVDICFRWCAQANAADTRIVGAQQQLRLCVHCKEWHRQIHSSKYVAKAYSRVRPYERRQPHYSMHRQRVLDFRQSVERKDTVLQEYKSPTRCHHAHRPRHHQLRRQTSAYSGICFVASIVFEYEVGF